MSSEMEENKPSKTDKRKKAALIFLVVFLTLFSIITLIGYFFLDPFLKRQISRSVYQSSNGQYMLSIGGLNSDIWTGNVYFSNLVLLQDTLVLKKLQAENPDEYFPFITLRAKSASINNFRWLNYIIHRDLKVGEITINEPSLKVVGEDPSESLRSANKNFVDLLPAIIAGFAGSLRIGALVVNSGIIDYQAYDEEGLLAQQAEDIFIDITEIYIDTVSTQRLLYSQDISFHLKNYHLKNLHRDQTISIAEMEASLSDSVFLVTKFHLEQNKKKTPENNEADLAIQTITGEGVDFKSFLYGKKILMDKIRFEAPSIYLATKAATTGSEKENKGIPKTIAIPEILGEILQSFTINLISVRNGIINNKITSDKTVTQQSAKNLAIDIARVEGKTLDSLELTSPDEINIRFTNYQLTSSHPSVRINMNSFEGSTSTGALNLVGLTIHFLDQKEKGTSLSIYSRLKSAEGSGFNLKTVLDQQKIIFNSFLLRSPEINIFSKGKKPSSENSELNRIFDQGIPDPLSAFIKSFEIENFSIQDGALSSQESAVENPIHQRIGRINVKLTKLHTNSPEDPIDFQHIYLSASDYFLEIGKEQFSFTVPSATLSSSDNSAVLKNVKLVQDHPPGKEANHYTVTIPAISSSSFDVKKAIRAGAFIARKVDVMQMRGEFLIHKSRPDYAEKMPNELVREIDFYFRFDTVDFSKAFVSHADATGELTTLITFENGTAKLTNLTNDKRLMRPETPSVFDFTAYLFGEGKLEATIRVPLLSSSFNGNYDGNFYGINGSVFNTILKNANFQLESGVVDSGSFNIAIRNGNAHGTVTLLYHDLDVEILSDEGKKSRIKSLFGNLAVKNNNPDDQGDAPEVAEVDAVRHEHDSFFYFLWRPVLEGILKTVTKGRFLPEEFTEK